MSFGWCFWHRACYGCLLCGNRTVRNTGPGSKDRVQGRDVCAEDRTGHEVYEPPLCISCETDTVSTELSLHNIVDAGLTHVESVDGGITRQRWRKRQGFNQSVPKLGIRIMYETASNIADLVQRLTRYRPKRTSSRALQAVANTAGPSNAPNKSRRSFHHNKTAPSLIWVDSKDPVNGTAFQPYHLKPIPSFMTRRIVKTNTQ